MLKRRSFIQYSATALALLPLSPASGMSLPQTGKKNSDTLPAWIDALVQRNDASVEALLKVQEKNDKSPEYGGLQDHQEMFNPHSTAAFIQVSACAYFAPKSTFYRSATLLNQVHLAVKYLLRIQHSDGTIDLLSTNFHSTPDTGFLVKRLANAYQLLQKSGVSGPVLENLKTFLLQGGEALSKGGIHTPNHRWVVSAALSRLYELWPDPRYLNRIEQWLAEGIDMDADGQYNERSTFIYSSLSDRILLTLAKSAGKPKLLDYVRRNLDMTLYYVHPNGEVVTDASGRQDKALVGTLENYYYPYRYLAIHDKNSRYAAMCRFIEQTAKTKIVGFLDYYLNDPSLWGPLPESVPLPETYVKAFPHSGLVRIREKDWDSTLIARNPTWFTFMKNNAVIQGIRFASSFFGKGQFQSDQVTAIEDGWKLTQHLEGPYYQPLPQNLLPGDGDWEKMPRDKRPQSEIQVLDTTIVIRKKENGMEIEISTSGTERVPVALELIFRPGGALQGVTAVKDVPNSWLLREGTGSYTFEDNTVTFGPGTGRHTNTALRGSLPHTGSPTVYLTGFTPFHHILQLS